MIPIEWYGEPRGHQCAYPYRQNRSYERKKPSHEQDYVHVEVMIVEVERLSVGD
jgi:hypothetical protein